MTTATHPLPLPVAARGGLTESASLTSIAYELGSLKPIDELDFLRDDRSRLELYKLAGFEFYAESELSMRELAQRSAVRTLEASGVDRRDIGVCLYVAESFGRDEPVSSAEVNRLLVDLGLDHAMPIHVSISDCANILTALRIAAALIAAGEARHVLIVSVDKAPRRYAGRRMFQEMSVKSDVSLSCLVAAPGVGAYGILYLRQHSVAGLLEVGATDAASYSMPKFKSIRHAAKEAKEVLALHATDFARILTNNYGREVAKMFVELCGFPKQAASLGNIGRFAHAVAGDVLINLQDLDSAGAIRSGDRIFVLADSITTSSVLCLQKH